MQGRINLSKYRYCNLQSFTIDTAPYRPRGCPIRHCVAGLAVSEKTPSPASIQYYWPQIALMHLYLQCCTATARARNINPMSSIHNLVWFSAAKAEGTAS